MRSKAATTRRVRFVTVLAVAAAATVMLGALMLAAGVAMPHVTKHPPLPPAIRAAQPCRTRAD